MQSAILSAHRAEEMGLARDRIILSAKVSAVQDLIACYRMLADRTDHALHLGLTEAGMGSKGLVALLPPWGAPAGRYRDTIRYSLTPEPGGDRTLEVKASQELLQTMGFRSFTPQAPPAPAAAAPPRLSSRSWRRTSRAALHLHARLEDALTPRRRGRNVAVMAASSTGPGESKHADIGIRCPHRRDASAPVLH